MNSTLLQIASKYVQWLLILVAVIALFRGHNYREEALLEDCWQD
jgi:hypothetical protein